LIVCRRERGVIRLDGGGAPRRVRRGDDHSGRGGRVRRADSPRCRVATRMRSAFQRRIERTAVRRARPENVTKIIVCNAWFAASVYLYYRVKFFLHRLSTHQSQ